MNLQLGTCDLKGCIYVWTKYEGRWSIELINDRNKTVTDFAWSHNGKLTCICYEDNFVLVGSVSGQRHWSNMFDSLINTVTFTPNDAYILFGLSNGHILVIDEHGTFVNKISIVCNDSIQSIAYNSPNFFMDDGQHTHSPSTSSQPASKNTNGHIFFFVPFGYRCMSS
jgi:hypothetical protein